MKIKKLVKKLEINKETVSNLNDQQLTAIRGGVESVSRCATDCISCGKTWCTTCIM